MVLKISDSKIQNNSPDCYNSDYNIREFKIPDPPLLEVNSYIRHWSGINNDCSQNVHDQARNSPLGCYEHFKI